MKTKDLVYIALAGIIFLAAGYIAYTQLSSKKSSSKGVTVEVVGPISADLGKSTLELISDPSKTTDFNSPIDLTTGLNNSNPFGQ